MYSIILAFLLILFLLRFHVPWVYPFIFVTGKPSLRKTSDEEVFGITN